MIARSSREKHMPMTGSGARAALALLGAAAALCAFAQGQSTRLAITALSKGPALEATRINVSRGDVVPN